MENNAHYKLVGIFVITLIAAIVLGIIWLSSGFSFEHYKSYMVYMQESISGLSIDGPVEYNGVNVGTVKSIELNQKNPQLVELLLSIKSTTPITKGTIATLNTRGFTGVAFVALKDKSTDLRPLLAEPGEPYPIIPTAPSFFLRLDTALTQLTRNFKSIADSFNKLLDKDNQLAIKTILKSLEVFTEELAANKENFTIILNNASKASDQLTTLLQSSTITMRLIQDQTIPGTSQVLNNLNDLTRNLSEFSTLLKQNPSVVVRGADQQTLGPGETR